MRKSRFYFCCLRSAHGIVRANGTDRYGLKGHNKNLTKKQARWHIIMLLQTHGPLRILKLMGESIKEYGHCEFAVAS